MHAVFGDGQRGRCRAQNGSELLDRWPSVEILQYPARVAGVSVLQRSNEKDEACAEGWRLMVCDDTKQLQRSVARVGLRSSRKENVRYVVAHRAESRP